MLLHGAGGPSRDAFPRSTTMRLLVGVGSEFVAATVAQAAVSGVAPGSTRGMLGRLPLAALVRLVLRRFQLKSR